MFFTHSYLTAIHFFPFLNKRVKVARNVQSTMHNVTFPVGSDPATDRHQEKLLLQWQAGQSKISDENQEKDSASG